MFNTTYDIRYHDFHLIEHHSWSHDLHLFPGIPQAFDWEFAMTERGDFLNNFMKYKWHYSFYISALYLVVIFSLQKFMQRYEKGFNLRPLLTAWNIFLAIFSIMGTIRCMPEFVHVLTHHGVKASFAKSTYYLDFRLSLWYLLFTLSKAIELFDTLFIVLRKNKLITLHWVHHVLTLCYSWFVFSDVPGTARWMVNMNFFIHSLMYTYYAFKAMRFTIPRFVNMTITTLQIAQMFAGLYVNYRSLQLKVMGLPCDISFPVCLTGFTLYGLFAVLFINFFLRTYVFKSKSKAVSAILSDINHNKEYTNFLKKLQ